MTPESLIIVVLGVALITGGTVAFKAWLKTRAEVRKAEIEAETTKSTSQDDQEERIRFYEVNENQTRANERNFGLLVEAIRREPVLGDIDAATEPARHRIVKAVSEENGGRVAGVDLPAGTAAEVTHTKRQESVEVQIDGHFRVAKVDTTVPDGFRVTLSRDGQDDVVASVLDVMKSEQQRLLLKEAEWSKRPVFVAISARKLRSRIVDAVIEDVRPIADHDVAYGRPVDAACLASGSFTGAGCDAVQNRSQHFRRRACSNQIPEVGLVVRIKCGDGLGSYACEGRYFLHDDGRFYDIDSAVRVEAKVTN